MDTVFTGWFDMNFLHSTGLKTTKNQKRLYRIPIIID